MSYVKASSTGGLRAIDWGRAKRAAADAFTGQMMDSKQDKARKDDDDCQEPPAPATSVGAGLLYGDFSNTLSRLDVGIRSAKKLRRRMAKDVLHRVGGNREKAAEYLHLDRREIDELVDSEPDEEPRDLRTP